MHGAAASGQMLRKPNKDKGLPAGIEMMPMAETGVADGIVPI